MYKPAVWSPIWWISLCWQWWQWEETLRCICVCVCFHCVMCFQWHPGWCAVVFSSHCNSDSKTVCLIVLWSFHVLHKAGKVGLGNGCFVLWTLRRGTLQNLWADKNTLMVPISSSSSLFTQWLEPPVEGRCDLFEVRVEVFIHWPTPLMWLLYSGEIHAIQFKQKNVLLL